MDMDYGLEDPASKAAEEKRSGVGVKSHAGT